MENMLAASSFTFVSFDAVVQGFAAAASFLGVGSGLVAWLAWDDGRRVGQVDTAGVADAAGFGLALSFWPSMLAGGVVFIGVAIKGLTES